MTLYEQYKDIMCRFLSLQPDEVILAEYKGSEEWSSLNHLMIIDELEKQFNCNFSRSDILGFQTFNDGLRILKEKGVLD